MNIHGGIVQSLEVAGDAIIHGGIITKLIVHGNCTQHGGIVNKRVIMAAGPTDTAKAEPNSAQPTTEPRTAQKEEPPEPQRNAKRN